MLKRISAALNRLLRRLGIAKDSVIGVCIAMGGRRASPDRWQSETSFADAWEPWWLAWQAPAAVAFFVAGVAELARTPFDMPVADSEIVFGPYTEYSGLRFAFFLLSEYAGIVVLAALTTVLFLGGWQGPGPEWLGVVWTLLKVALVSFLVIWVRVAWPRVREDQLQALAWKVLVPLTLAQLALTGVVVVATA